MKKIFILFLSTIAFSSLLKAQIPGVKKTDVYTPNSSVCVSWITEEDEDDVRRTNDNMVSIYYLATPVKMFGSYYSTRTFNCHGYAWLQVEDGRTRWIGNGDSEVGFYPDIFMTDHSYTKITAAVPYAKVFVDRPGDHSGVIQPDGKVISKWCDGPLMKHDLNYGPTGYKFNGSVSYWVKTSSLAVDGPSLVCGANTFSIKSDSYSITPAETMSWEKSANLSFNGSFNSTSVSVSPNGSGAGWVIFKINGIERARKNVWVGVPSISTINGPRYVQLDSWDSFTAVLNGGGPTSSHTWYISRTSGVDWYIWGSQTDHTIYVTFYTPDTYQIGVRATNACGTPLFYYVVLDVGSRSVPSGAFAYPNPVDNMLTVDLDAYAAANPALSSSARIAYDIRLYDSQGNMLRQQRAGGGTVQIDVSTLPDGIYFLHIYDGVSSNPEVQRIIVKH